MKTYHDHWRKIHSKFQYFGWALAFAWTAIIAASFVWYYHMEQLQTIEGAHAATRISIEKDIIYRSWGAMHGGVYVPATDETPPNLYLKVPERDIQTPSGQMLTLINPAYMIRLVEELGAKSSSISGHLTSLNPINPNNVADPWEANALHTFENGESEAGSVEMYNGQAQYRYMRPLVVDESCLTCHAEQGYRLGDVRGGLSVAVPMAPLWASSHKQTLNTAIAHSLLWSLGLLILFVGTRNIQAHVTTHGKYEDKIKEYQENLETLVEQRTEKLKEAEEQSRLLLESVTDGIFGVDAEGIITFINPSALHFLKYSHDELIGKEVHCLIHHSHADNTPYAIEDCPMYVSYTEGASLEASDEVLWCKDHTHIEVEYSSTPIKRGSEIIGAVVTFRDIAERKKRESLTLLNAEIGDILISDKSLQEKLQNCAEAFVTHINVAFSRIWTIDHNEEMLHLLASAGLYTHIDGIRAQVPVYGKKKISIIAREGRPYINENVCEDPLLDDKDWAKENNLVSFYGYPMKVEGKVIGVLAMFFTKVFTKEYLEQLTTIANAIALTIVREEAEVELKNRMEELERFNRLTVHREEKMIQLKEEINTLQEQSGKEKIYKIVE
jgi:PAS domain S-box-containing protein